MFFFLQDTPCSQDLTQLVTLTPVGKAAQQTASSPGNYWSALGIPS